MRTRLLIPAMLGALALAGCNDSTGPGSGGAQVSLSFTTFGTAGVPQAPAAQGLRAGYSTSDTQGNTLVITKAEVVLREIELKRLTDDDCATGDCEEFETGPVLIDVPLDGTATQTVAVAAPPDTYRELEFKIHKVTSDTPDAAFRAMHPHMADMSIRVAGTFTDATGPTQFVFGTDLDVGQEYDIIPPLVVTADAATTNVTVRVDLSQWFVDTRGQTPVLVNPETGNVGGLNESWIKENIKTSFQAYKDEDGDGDDQDEIEI